ncbi:MAG: M20/M25/M40 family metallo-hydrolase [Clostridia bacterium]|nr:M20/M25/M40 family metallo-hydrolase [Clostridia bacterium]
MKIKRNKKVDMSRADLYAENLSKLIQVETISEYNQDDKSKFYKFHDVLREMFPNLFAVCEFEDFNGSFLMKWQGTSDDLPLLYMNHHDVVEGTGEWKHAPFSGDIAEGKVWGRGTLDTKGGLWGMMQAADELAKEGFVPRRTLYIESACTEETDGAGCDHITNVLKERGIKLFMTLDEGGMILEEPIPGAKGKYAMVGVGEKGCADIKFIARSNGGHASTPPKNTPLVRLGKFMVEAEKAKIFDVELNDVVAEMFRRVSKGMSGALKIVLGHPKFFKPLIKTVMPAVSGTAAAMLRTTIAFTTAAGSDGLNVIPQTAYVTGNMRFSHHQGGEASIKAVTELAKKYDIEVEIIDPGFQSPLSSFDSDAFRLVEKAIDEVFDDVKTAPYIMTGASDSRYMGRICDNCIRFAPFTISDEQLGGIHGLNECVDISCLEPAVDFYKYIIKNA